MQKLRGFAAGAVILVFGAGVWFVAVQLRSLSAGVAQLTAEAPREELGTLSESVSQLSREASELRAALDDVDRNQQKAIGECQAYLQQNADILNWYMRTAGATTLPPGSLDALRAIDDEIATPDRWPKTMEEAEDLRARLVAALNELPVWAEQDNAPLLNRINWAVEVLWTLRRDDVPAEESLSAIVEEYQVLLSVAPEEDRLSQLRSRLNKALKKVQAAEAAYLVKRARALLNTPPPLDNETEAEALWIVERFTGNVSDKHREEHDDLRDKVRTHLLYSNSVRLAESFREQLALIEQAASLSTKRAGLLHLHDAVTRHRVGLITEGLEVREIIALHDDLEAILEQLAVQDNQRRSAAIRRYQVWALEQIEIFNKEFDTRSETAQNLLDQIKKENAPAAVFRRYPGIWLVLIDAGIVYDPSKDLLVGVAYEKLTGWLKDRNFREEAKLMIVRDSIVEYLSPIDQTLLELPVNLVFQKAHERGWNALGETEQLHVAKQSAVVVKKPLDSFVLGGTE